MHIHIFALHEHFGLISCGLWGFVWRITDEDMIPRMRVYIDWEKRLVT